MRELEIYIHIPFCVRKCAYCDFLSAPAGEDVQEQYVRALISEIRAFPREDWRIRSIFFGGGTPSLLRTEWMEEILGAVWDTFGRPGIFKGAEARAHQGSVPEITLECNPGTADAAKLRAYADMGINRLSLGLQSSDNRELALLGRIHTWEDFLRTYDEARLAGFQNINVDLISALPGQSAASWERTLRRVTALRPEHISAYSLIIEEGTPFYQRFHEDDERRARGEEPQFLPSEEEERRMYCLTEEVLAEAGMHRYEISNYSVPGCACLHNIGYWTGVEYVGFGLGASSLLGHVRCRNTGSMEDYLANPSGHRTAEPLTRQDEMEEFMFLGLRMMEGISERVFEERFHQPFDEVYGKTAEKLVRQRLLAREAGRVFLTKEGISLSNLAMAEFLL